MQGAVTIAVTGVEHHLNRFALQLTTADPDQRANPCGHTTEFQNLSGRESIEVANQNVKAVLMSLDAVEE